MTNYFPHNPTTTMNDYYNVVRRVLDYGDLIPNRTGINATSLTGQSMTFDVSKRFPLLTARAVPFRSIVAELLTFLQGGTSAADFRANGTKIWDANANQNPDWLANPFRTADDDLGEVYGAQWRRWPAYRWGDTQNQQRTLMSSGWQKLVGNLYTKEVDQLQEAIDKLRTDPYDRRMIWHAHNPANLSPLTLALPACHLLYQLHGRPESRLNMTVYIRSNDLGLGAPFNIASVALLMRILGWMTDRTPHILTIQVGDAHVYENHIGAMNELLGRHSGDMGPVDGAAGLHPLTQEPTLTRPDLDFSGTLDQVLRRVMNAGGADVIVRELHNYRPMSALKMEMAV